MSNTLQLVKDIGQRLTYIQEIVKKRRIFVDDQLLDLKIKAFIQHRPTLFTVVMWIISQNTHIFKQIYGEVMNT